MYGNNAILLQQICRFGMLSFPQLRKLNASCYTRQSLSRYLSALWNNGYLKKVVTSEYRRGIYAATPFAYRELYNFDGHTASSATSNKIEHALKFAEVIFMISKFENVTGIATEYELSKSDIQNFAIGRIPDGIIQIEREGSVFETAVEFELHQKSEALMRNVFQAYEKTFKAALPCKAVFIICEQHTIERAYLKLLEKYPASFQKRIKILARSEIANLDTEYFGQPTKSIDRFWMVTRRQQQGWQHPRYEIIRNFDINAPATRHIHTDTDNDLEVHNG